MSNYPQFKKVHDPSVLTAYIAEKELGQTEARKFLIDVGTLCSIYVLWQSGTLIRKKQSRQNIMARVYWLWSNGFIQLPNLQYHNRNLSYEDFSKRFFAFTRNMSQKERKHLLESIDTNNSTARVKSKRPIPKPSSTIKVYSYRKNKKRYYYVKTKPKENNDFEYGLTDT